MTFEAPTGLSARVSKRKLRECSVARARDGLAIHGKGKSLETLERVRISSRRLMVFLSRFNRVLNHQSIEHACQAKRHVVAPFLIGYVLEFVQYNDIPFI